MPTTFRLATLAALALSLAACQDPSGVGLTLLGDETSDPNAQLVAADSVYLAELAESTAGFAAGGGTPLQTQVLVGEAQDPLLGDTRAIAYVDARAVARPEGFTDRPLAQVQLRLRRAFVYGDTLSTLPVELREVTDSWSPEGLPIDTTLATGPVITTGMFAAQDTLVTIDLPASYVTANTVELRDSLDTRFEGFQIRVPEGMGGMPGAVIGFDATLSSLRLIGTEYESDGETTRDTVDYPIVEVYTAIARGVAPEAPGRVLLRDGTPTSLGIDVDVAAFANLPLANATVRIPFDRSFLDAGMGFNRPLPQNLALFAVYDDDSREFLLERAVPADGDVLVFRDSFVTRTVQNILLGRKTLTRFEIVPASTPFGLGTLPVIVEDEVPGDLRRPRLSLLLTGGPPA